MKAQYCLFEIVVLNCQKCNQYLKVTSLQDSLLRVFSKCLCLCLVNWGELWVNWFVAKRDKPGWWVGNANRKVFARPECFCASGEFLRVARESTLEFLDYVSKKVQIV